jgi:hypothetical protein
MHELPILVYRHEVYDYPHGIYNTSTKPRKLAIQDFWLDSKPAGPHLPLKLHPVRFTWLAAALSSCISLRI